MARQAAPFRAARPDIKAPVMHYSLSLQAGDGRKTPEEWKPIVESFLTKMGVPLDAAWTSYLHNDTTIQHCHIAFLRSFGDGEVWNREFSAKRAIQATAEIEKEFGLLTHDRTPNKQKKRQSVEEKRFEKQLQKQGKVMSREHIARQVDDFIESRKGASYSIEELRAGLAGVGIQVEVTERGGQLAGVKFQHEGIWISGSSIGDGYKAQGLVQRGLSAAPPAAQASPLVHTDSRAEKAGKNDAAQDDTPPAVFEHNTRAASLGELLAKGLSLPIEAMVKLIQMIIKMINRLFGRREEAAGAPAGVLGRFSETTGHFQPGKVPGRNEVGHGKALAAVGAAAGDVAALSQHATQGKQWSELLEHGAAPYKHQDGAAASYFARLRLPGGKETEVWGVDIQRALEDAGINTGDQVILERAGRQNVTIKQVGADGGVTEKTVHRNAWKADKPAVEASSQAPRQGAAAPADQAELLAKARADWTSLRDSAIRYLRDKAEHAAHVFGSNGAEHSAAMAELQKVGFGPADEIKYQAWRESEAAQPLEGETADDYMRRREIEYIGDRLAFHDQYKVGMTDQERQQQARRLAELHSKQIERDVERQRERG